MRRLSAVLALVVLSTQPAGAHTWNLKADGSVIGDPPKTPAQLLDFCVTNPGRCSISVQHVSGQWERHLQADRLNPVASTYKLLTLLGYAQRVADGRTRPTQRLSRDQWARFWIGADGEELRSTRTGPIVDANGGTYRIRRVDGRPSSGALRRSWVHLDRPPRVTVDDLAQVMIRYSDNAAADWFLHAFGEPFFESFIDRQLSGYHDTPPSINAMFLSYFLNPDVPGRPAIGERMLSAYSGYPARGFRDEMARWFSRLEDPGFVARARSCQPAVLPWDQRIGACPPQVGEPGEEQLRRLFNRYSVQSTTRSQAHFMTRMLERSLLDAAAHDVAERSLEFRLDPRRFRDPRFRNAFRRYGAKSGSYRTNRGLSVLAWSAYFESQPAADGSTSKGAVSIQLRDLPGRQRDAQGGYSTADIPFELPLRFAEDVILNRGGLATALMRRLPAQTARPELVARVRRLEPRANAVDTERTLIMELRVRNIGAAATGTTTEVALFLRRAAGGPAEADAEPADQSRPVPQLAPGESVDLLFDVPVPAGRDFVSLVVDPQNRVVESTEVGDGGAGDNVQWERLRFPTVNVRSIGTRRGLLDAGDGRERRASGSAGSFTIRFDGAGRLAEVVGRGDKLVLAPGTVDEVIGHVASHDGKNRLTLQQPLGRSLVDVPFTIQRAFHNIQSWEDARQGDLVADERIEVGVLYGDGPLRCRPRAESGCRFDGDRAVAMATIDGSVTNAAHYLSLEVADGQRHHGAIGTGVVLDGEGAVDYGLRILDPHTRIAGLTLKSFGGRGRAVAISVERARHVLLENLLIHNFDGAEKPVAGVLGGPFGDFTLRNSVIHDGGGTGVAIDRPTASGRVENCTVVAMSAAGIREGDGLLDVRNTISMGNGGIDFRVQRGRQDHNLSSDGSAAGPGSITDRPAERQFLSLSAETRDLHLRPGADAAGAGSVLYPAFGTDIDGEPRPIGPSASWNIGADQ